jgi:excisionase family DNA binding protein
VSEPEQNPEWLTPNEAAAILGVRLEHIYTWVKFGDLSAVNVALDPDGPRPRWRISRVAVQNFLFDREATSRGYVKR